MDWQDASTTSSLLIVMVAAACTETALPIESHGLALDGARHLLISEVALSNNSREFVEIYNPDGAAVDLSDYFLSDDADYHRLPGVFGNGPVPSLDARDFIAKFPDGATIAPGQAVVVALRYQGFETISGVTPDFGFIDLPESSTGIAMIDPSTLPGAAQVGPLIDSDPQLSNSGEGIVLFRWDRASDLVEDVDMFLAGANPPSSNNLADKTGASVDGPDADGAASTYQPDAFSFTQVDAAAGSGYSHKRIAFEDGHEMRGVGGNGVGGDDETSEDFAATWDRSQFTAPTPGEVPASLQSVCGDGFIDRAANEECDDGNADDSDACPTTCQLATCGDGFTRLGVEYCDAAGVSTAGCDADCTAVACGDGFWNQAAGEQCDDGNTADGDGCSATCTNNTCADGVQNLDEIDVDCGGHCGVGSCSVGQTCTADADCAGAGACQSGTCHMDEILAVGLYHVCARTASGEVRCWGRNSFGQLGQAHLESVGDDELPSLGQALVFSSPVTKVSAGFLHSCALTASGAVRCWGDNSYGQLGRGDTVHVGDNELASATADVALGGVAVDIATGGYHTCALLDTGAMRCWGDNSRGQLGYFTSGRSYAVQMNIVGDDETPATAGDVDVGGAVRSVAAGGQHTCALLMSGAVRCWGDNRSGQLGRGDTEMVGDDESPASTAPLELGGQARQLALGMAHGCALLDTGAVRCWGRNTSGQLGHGHQLTIGDDETPAAAGDVPIAQGARFIAAGATHTCALMASSALRCWGDNKFGQLGQGHVSDLGDDEPVSSIGDIALGSDEIVMVAPGYGVTCVAQSPGIRCFGNNRNGQLGYGHTQPIGDDETPLGAGWVSWQ